MVQTGVAAFGRLALLLGVAGAQGACVHASSVNVALLQSPGSPLVSTPPSNTPLEVVTRSTAIPDPLPVESTNVTYSDLEHTLGLAVSTGVADWASTRANPPKDGWQLFVELTQAHAEYEDGRLLVTMAVQATLRRRAGNVYVAQTQANCRQAGIVAPHDGAPIFHACMTRIGRDIDGWLGGLGPA
jgi:hypothetical protein